jgi:hypothetical protein
MCVHPCSVRAERGYERSLIRALSGLYAAWSDQFSIAFRKDLSKAYKKVWPPSKDSACVQNWIAHSHASLSLSLQVWLQFQDEGGFEFGLAHSVVDALLYLLQEAYQWLSLVLPPSELWAIVPVTSADEVIICSHPCE